MSPRIAPLAQIPSSDTARDEPAPQTATAPLPPPTPAVAPSTATARHPAGPPTPPAPAKRAPTPTAELLARLQRIDVERVEAVLDGVRAAWRRGDDAAISEALIEQAALLEALGVKLLELAGANPAHFKQVECYGGLGLRALEQARKTLDTLAGLRAKPRVTTAVQVNVEAGGSVRGVVGGGRSANEVLAGDGDE